MDGAGPRRLARTKRRRRLGFRYAALDELLAASDVHQLHVPSLPETAGLLSAAAFSRMKAGAVLINTARGDLIDTPALIQALSRAAGWPPPGSTSCRTSR